MARTTDWLDPQEMAAWRAFVDASAAVMARTEADLLAAHGISAGEYAVLVHLSEAEGGGQGLELRARQLAHEVTAHTGHMIGGGRLEQGTTGGSEHGPHHASILGSGFTGHETGPHHGVDAPREP